MTQVLQLYLGVCSIKTVYFSLESGVSPTFFLNLQQKMLACADAMPKAKENTLLVISFAHSFVISLKVAQQKAAGHLLLLAYVPRVPLYTYRHN